MKNPIWRAIARIASRPAVADWLIRRAQRTPYTHITSADGQDIYMGRWWLLNPYCRTENGGQGPARFAWLPSIRIHHIRRADQDRHLHDHPWNARTIILRGWYREERPLFDGDVIPEDCTQLLKSGDGESRMEFTRTTGHTGRLLFGQYHRISQVSGGGVWTVFITWRKRGTWGFDVKGKKVPWREYLGIQEVAAPTSPTPTPAQEGKAS